MTFEKEAFDMILWNGFTG